MLVENKKCIQVSFCGFDVPYSADGRYYIRVGDEDRKLSTAEVTKIILDTRLKNLRWDSQPYPDTSITDISSAKIKAFLKIAGLNMHTIANTLENLNLTDRGILTNTALLLFAKQPEKFFQNAMLRCAVFTGETTSYIADRQEFTGDIFFLIKKAEEYIIKNIYIGMRIEGLRREDVPEIDQEAIREVVVNAFCHRDYFDPDSITILVFKDRVEVRNPGGLTGGLTIQDIRTKKVSKRRNELICNIFHRAHYVEKFGRGISFVLEREPNAQFEQVGDIFISTLFRKESVKHGDRLVNGLVNGLSYNQQKILELMQINPKITTRMIASKTKISLTTVDNNIKKLKEHGYLRRIGNQKSGYWEILNR